MIDLAEQVDPLNCPDKQRPAFPVSESGPRNLIPKLGLHLRNFVEHREVKPEPAKGVRVIGAEQADRRAVVREL